LDGKGAVDYKNNWYYRNNGELSLWDPYYNNCSPPGD
jgi:hypothetical protein